MSDVLSGALSFVGLIALMILLLHLVGWRGNTALVLTAFAYFTFGIGLFAGFLIWGA